MPFNTFNHQLKLINHAITNIIILLGDFNLDWQRRYDSTYAYKNYFNNYLFDTIFDKYFFKKIIPEYKTIH